MNITLISPRLAIQKWDFLGSGVPYWPLEMAVFAGALRQGGDTVCVADLFGRASCTLSDAGDHLLQGQSITALFDTDLCQKADAFVVYALSYMSFRELVSITRLLKERFPTKPLAILENSQAVTAFALDAEAEAFLAAGADFLICGEAYANLTVIRRRLAGGAEAASNIIDAQTPKPYAVQRLFEKDGVYPRPAWDLFPLQGYWRLPYAHGPKRGNYFPLLTSRGCPYPCDFCVIPDTNDRRWRARRPEEVVDEIIALRDAFGVRDFHVEDVNPTVNFKMWERICALLIARKAHIRFSFVSGTKAETVPIDKVPLLAQAGCRYISISPESGDPAVMRRIGKKFNYAHGRDLIAACHAVGIRTQACFLTGHPGETEASIDLSAAYLRELLRAGLDEAAIFIVAPFPGSAVHKNNEVALTKTGLVSFSPHARQDYACASARRGRLIKLFFIEKLRRGTLWTQALRALFRRPATKMENLPWRLVFLVFIYVRYRWRGLAG